MNPPAAWPMRVRISHAEVTMKNRAHCGFLLIGVALFLATGASQAQEKETVKKSPIQDTSPSSGQEMFKSYCTVCHGKDANGAGPAIADLKTTPLGPDDAGQTARRKVSRRRRLCCERAAERYQSAGSRQFGNAGLGTAFWRGKRGRPNSDQHAGCQPGALPRIFAGEISTRSAQANYRIGFLRTLLRQGTQRPEGG